MKTYSYTLEQIQRAQQIFEQKQAYNKNVSLLEALEQAMASQKPSLTEFLKRDNV